MIFEKVAQALSEHMSVDISQITKDTSFKDLNLDSLDLVELMMGLEDIFGISLEPDESIKTVGDLVLIIEKAGPTLDS